MHISVRSSLNNESISMDETVSVLATIPNLENVRLEVSNRRRASVVGSERAAKKVQVTLSGAGLAKLIGDSKSIQTLYLNRLNLNTGDFSVLAEAIKTAPCLREFSLPHCNLDDDGCVKIAEAISLNPTLEKIDLSCNKLTDEGCITLASALEGNHSVKFLRLWGNVKISNNGFDSIREMLEYNCVLERVPLMATNISYDKLDPVKNGRSGQAA
jgi:Ran GTPase-activating protein (RanGAP) involved in mRNA processing and transport